MALSYKLWKQLFLGYSNCLEYTPINFIMSKRVKIFEKLYEYEWKSCNDNRSQLGDWKTNRHRTC